MRKIYTKDLTFDEIINRLKKGERIFTSINNYSLEMKDNVVIEYDENNRPKYYNAIVCLQSDVSYFLEEVKETLADLSSVGKLCKFWNGKNSVRVYGLLACITKEGFYKPQKGGVYTHCEPLTMKEVKQFIKEA